MNELTDLEREAVAVAREKIGTGGYALFNRLYLEFDGYRAEMHFAHGYLVAITQLDALRADLLAANERATTLEAALRAAHDARGLCDANTTAKFKRLAAMFRADTGLARPSVDYKAWDCWIKRKDADLDAQIRAALGGGAT